MHLKCAWLTEVLTLQTLRIPKKLRDLSSIHRPRLYFYILSRPDSQDSLHMRSSGSQDSTS